MVTGFLFGNKNIENRLLNAHNTQSAPGSYAGATRLDLEAKASTISLLDAKSYSSNISVRSSSVPSVDSREHAPYTVSSTQYQRFSCDTHNFSSSTTAIQLDAEPQPVFLHSLERPTANVLSKLPQDRSGAQSGPLIERPNERSSPEQSLSAATNSSILGAPVHIESNDCVTSNLTGNETGRQLSCNMTAGDEKRSVSQQSNSSWWSLFYSAKSTNDEVQPEELAASNSGGPWITPLWTRSANDDAQNGEQKRKRKIADDNEELRTKNQSESYESGIKNPPPSPAGTAEPESRMNAKVNAGVRSWAFWARSSDKYSEFSVSGTSTENHPFKARRIESNEEAAVEERTEPSEELKVETTKKTKKAKKDQPVKPNLVTPTASMCYPLYSSVNRLKSSLFKLAQYMRPSGYVQETVTEHDPLYRTTPKKIHKVVIIGVHGFFPTKVIRAVLGEPTGTSIKFANEAAKSVERWANEKGFEVHIEKIALEGEGKILKRVDTLYELLSNWLHLIHQADFIYFAAHSQGTPVAVHLLARLIEEGHVEKKIIGILGMAGISLGPISGLDQKLVMRAISSIESASLRELFEFQRLDSRQSTKYIESLRTVIAHNVKIVFVGSMNDQLVPLYSSTCAHISHPNVYRAVFVDSEAVSSDFISTVVSIALRLRNVGSTDHGFIREVSPALPGTLTSGGHSRLYDEARVYDLLIRHALETTDAPNNLPLKVDTNFDIPKDNNNPYLLPWTMRGLINEAVLRPSFANQLDSLHEEFTNWKPDSKQMKDLKYRLSAIQSKL